MDQVRQIRNMIYCILIVAVIVISTMGLGYVAVTTQVSLMYDHNVVLLRENGFTDLKSLPRVVDDSFTVIFLVITLLGFALTGPFIRYIYMRLFDLREWLDQMELAEALSGIIDMQKTAILVIDLKDYDIIYTNNVLCERFGLDKNEMVGRPMTDLIPIENGAFFVENFINTHPNGTSKMEIPFKVGSEMKPINASIVPVIDRTGERRYLQLMFSIKPKRIAKEADQAVL